MTHPRLCREGRDNRFDSLRLTLALTVLCAHSYFAAEGHQAGGPLARLSLNQITLGSLAVDAFFAISGFLVTQSWIRSRGIVDFLRRRALRIYPGYVVACLFIALVAAPLGASSISGYWADFQWDRFLETVALLRQPLIPRSFLSNPARNIVGGAMWTISFEFGCYLAVAFLGSTGLLRGRLVALLLILALAADLWCNLAAWSYMQVSGFWMPSERWNWRPWSDWTRFLSFFFAGSFAYLYRDLIPRSRRVAIWALIGLAVATQFPPGFVTLLPVAGVYLLFYAAFPPAGAVEPRRERPDLSYGVYLYSFPIQQLIVASMHGVGPWTLSFLAIPPTLVVALASWYLIERPFLSWKSPWRKTTDTPGV